MEKVYIKYKYNNGPVTKTHYKLSKTIKKYHQIIALHHLFSYLVFYRMFAVYLCNYILNITARQQEQVVYITNTVYHKSRKRAIFTVTDKIVTETTTSSLCTEVSKSCDSNWSTDCLTKMKVQPKRHA